MTDRELLELAAKAVGLKYTVKDDEYYKTHAFWGLWIVYDRQPHGLDRRYWNPLTDDGDALRLAVKLHIDLELNNGSATGIWIDLDRSETHTVEEACDEEFQGWRAKEAATRRAIVRAAAEIGKSMP